MINATPVLPAILVLILSGNSSADELTDAAEGLCEAIKTCTLEVLAGRSLTDKLRQDMAPVLENSCAELRSQVQAMPVDHNLHQPAIACLISMGSLSCQLLHNAGVVKTPECTEYDRQLKAVSTKSP